MNKKMLQIITLFIAALCLISTSYAEPSGYYRWKDKEGNLKLSDRPPEAGIESEFVETPGSNKSRSTATPESGTETKVTNSTKPEQPLKMEALPEKNPARCKQAQSNMKAFEGHARIRITEADGTQRLLTEEEKQVEIERSKKAITENCN